MTASVNSFVPRLPQSFHTRGWAVPFTSPFLKYARLRLTDEGISNGRLEYLLPGLAGSGETYVIPHSLLSDIGELTVYDRTLLEMLAASPTLSPAALRNTVNTVAATGLAGSDTAKKARATIAREMDNWLQIHVFLVRAAVKKLGDGRVMPSGAEYSIKEGRDAVHLGLSVFSSDFDLTPEEVFTILETWAGIMSFYGTPRGTVKGPLYLLIVDMAKFNEEMSAWRISAPVRYAQMSAVLEKASKETIKEANAIIGQFAASIHKIDDTLALWKSRKSELTQAMEQLESLLDGWQRILMHWRESQALSELEQRDAIEKTALSIPILPQDYLKNRNTFWVELRATQAEWAYIVQPYVSGSTRKSLRKAFHGCRIEPL